MSNDAPARRLPSWLLFTVAVAIWSTTWHAVLYQLVYTTPELGVAIRFVLAGVIALAIAVLRGDRLRCMPREHAWLALQGVFMYSLAYLAVYHAERHVATGLVAVGYSASPLVVGIGAHWLWKTPLGTRFVLGGVLCMAGVALIFWPELARASNDEAARLGALFTVAAVLLSAVGSLAASRNAQRELPFWPAIGFGMLYGAALSAAVTVASGQSLMLPSAPSWWLSLAYLSLAGSVIAFACYLSLQGRIGPGAASTIGVMTPIFALVVSALFENYQPQALTWVGAVLALVGNVLILRPKLS